MAGDDAPFPGADAARRGDEFTLLDGQHFAAHDPRGLHPTRDADHEHDEQEDAGLRPQRGPQRVAEQHDDDQQQRQQRQRQEEIRAAHEQAVQALEVAGQHPDPGAEHQRQQHRREPHRQRNPSSREHLREHVASKVVGT